MKRYHDIRSEMRLFRYLAENRKIRYFRSPPGPIFTLYVPEYQKADPVLLALYVASAERAFMAQFHVFSAGYGCFRVSYTVVSESREEAEKIATYMASSEKIRGLTEAAVSTEIVIQSLEANQRASELLETAGSSLRELKQVKEALSIVEEEMGIEHDKELSPKERLEKLQDQAVKDPPSAESSFWRLGDLIGAVMGGLAKSLGG